jgi:ABC-type transport system substrate-binding protein
MTELVGTGPFIFRESRTGEYVRMTRNEHYMLYGDNMKLFNKGLSKWAQ